MKRLGLLKFAALVLCCFAAPDRTIAQTPPDHCWVKYAYDQAGNRIKREWWCGDPNGWDENANPKALPVNTIGVRAYPNPAADAFEVVTEVEVHSGEATLRDEHGRSAIRQRMQGTRTLFDTSGLANGIYVLEVRVADVEYSTRITVSH
jgi:hypothetical protein